MRISLKFPSFRTFSSYLVLGIAIGIGSFSYYLTKFSKICENPNQTTYWTHVINKWNPNGNLRTIERVFNRLGYKMVNGSEEYWDILWSVEFPYDMFPRALENLTGVRYINHIPGMTFLTNKKFLAISTQSKYIPVAFEFPRLKSEFLYYAKAKQDKKFVVKNFDNRGVKIVPTDEVNFQLGEYQFMQEFVDNPLLIDGHAFDMGVYVLITSVDPLRIYRWKTDIFMRFCPEPYHPFDDKNVEKYVVTETHKPVWEMPTFENLKNYLNFSTIEAFNHYLEKNEHSPNEFWAQVDDAIVSVILAKAIHIARHTNNFKNRKNNSNVNVFELVRFDFMIDDQMKLYIMEVNMSPNLTPASEKNDRLSVMYEQVVYNTLMTVGFFENDTVPSYSSSSLMLSSPENIATNHFECSICLNEEGDTDCFREACDLCMPCLSEESSRIFHKSYREHQRRGNMKRIFPTASYSHPKLMRQIQMSDQLLVKWFRAKCMTDPDWC